MVTRGARPENRAMRLALATLCALIAAVAHCRSAAGVGVRKCVDPTGHVTYTDRGCPGVAREVRTPLPELGHFPAPEGLASPPSAPHAPAAPRATPRPRARPVPDDHDRHRARATPDPRLVSARRFLSAGMTDAEVLAVAGRPDRVARGSGGARGGGAGARWIYLPAAGESDTITIVEIERGVVADVERRRVR